MKILFGLIENSTEAEAIAKNLFAELMRGKTIEAKDLQKKLTNKARSFFYLSEAEWFDILQELRLRDEKFQADYILHGEQIRFLHENKSIFPAAVGLIIDEAFQQNCSILELPVTGEEV